MCQFPFLKYIFLKDGHSYSIGTSAELNLMAELDLTIPSFYDVTYTNPNETKMAFWLTIARLIAYRKMLKNNEPSFDIRPAEIAAFKTIRSRCDIAFSNIFTRAQQKMITMNASLVLNFLINTQKNTLSTMGLCGASKVQSFANENASTVLFNELTKTTGYTRTLIILYCNNGDLEPFAFNNVKDKFYLFNPKLGMIYFHNHIHPIRTIINLIPLFHLHSGAFLSFFS